MEETPKKIKLNIITLKTSFKDKKPHYGNLVLAFSKEQALGTYIKVLSDLKKQLDPKEYLNHLKNNSIVKIGEYHPLDTIKIINTKEELYFTLDKINDTINELKKETK